MLAMGLLFASCSRQQPPASGMSEKTETDPLKLALKASGYTDVVPRQNPPDRLLGPLVADRVNIRATTGELNQQIGAVRGREIEFGGRVWPIENVYEARRSGRNIVVLQTEGIVFYFGDISGFEESRGNRFFLVTEMVKTGERAEFVIQ